MKLSINDFLISKNKFKLESFVLKAIFLLLTILQASATDIPNCAFSDTANITHAYRFPNGTYKFEGLLIPPDLVGTYNYEEISEGNRILVSEHLRGCVCKLKTCIRFCCHPKVHSSPIDGVCINELENDIPYSSYVNITFENGTQELQHVLNEFFVQQAVLPCKSPFLLLPHKYEEDKWSLFENGTMLRLYDKKLLSKDEYCLTPNGTDILNPMNCPWEINGPANNDANSIAMAISVPFLLVTIIVYSFIPELRNLLGKCLVCYLLSLAVGFILLIAINFPGAEYQSDAVCSALGYTTYFALTSAFFWMSVISFHLWQSYSGTSYNVQRYEQKKRFYMYSLYAWGIPVILTVLTVLAQMSNLEESLRPGIGEYYCWLKTNDWSALIYFYGPILLLLIFNFVMFILSALKINEVQKQLTRLTANREGSKHLRRQKEKYSLFVRLFIIMGITWLLEIVAYLVGTERVWHVVFYVSDFFNGILGVLIFVLFVMKRKILKLIKKSVCGKNESSESNSTQSDCPQEEISLQNCARKDAMQFVD